MKQQPKIHPELEDHISEEFPWSLQHHTAELASQHVSPDGEEVLQVFRIRHWMGRTVRCAVYRYWHAPSGMVGCFSLYCEVGQSHRPAFASLLRSARLKLDGLERFDHKPHICDIVTSWKSPSPRNRNSS